MTDLEFIKQCIDTGNVIRFYKWYKWEQVRDRVLTLDHHECVMCKGNAHKIRRANTVHHVNHLKQYPELGLSIWYIDEQGCRQRNLVSLCADCHNKVHDRYGFQNKSKEQLTVERWD
jgi:5-methylcytosine-specific restriction endonuclease McrA